MKKYICLSLICMLALSLFAGCTKKMTLTFDSQGGSPVSSTEIQTGKPVKFPSPPTKEKAYFAGWYTKPNGEGSKINDGAYFTSSAKLYAYWVSSKTALENTKKITVTFNANGGQCDTADAQILPGTTLAAIPEPTNKNYAFAGWYNTRSVKDVTTIVTTETIFNENTTLYANWRRIWTLKFSAPDAKNKEILTSIKVLDRGLPIGLPTPERDGYKFLYWYFTTNDIHTELKNDYAITKDYTLYAQWEKQ